MGVGLRCVSRFSRPRSCLSCFTGLSPVSDLGSCFDEKEGGSRVFIAGQGSVVCREEIKWRDVLQHTYVQRRRCQSKELESDSAARIQNSCLLPYRFSLSSTQVSNRKGVCLKHEQLFAKWSSRKIVSGDFRPV